MSPRLNECFSITLLFISSFVTVVESRSSFDSAGHLITNCPRSCEIAGPDPSNWTYHRNVETAVRCMDRPVMLDFAIATTLEASPGRWPVRTCSTFRGDSVLSESVGLWKANGSQHVSASINTTSESIEVEVKPSRAVPPAHPIKVLVSWNKTNPSAVSGQMIGALAVIQSTLRTEQSQVTRPTWLTVQYGQSIVSLYRGLEVSSGARDHLLSALVSHLEDGDFEGVGTLQAQACDEASNLDRTFGVIGYSTSAVDNLPLVQQALRSWAAGSCLPPLAISVPCQTPGWAVVPLNTTSSDKSSLKNTTLRFSSGRHQVKPAHPKDVHQKDLSAVSRVVKPTPNADGSCAAYFVQSGDTCGDLADQHGITVDDLEKFNADTWQWSNCGMMWAGINICLSEGSPPMPAPVPDTQCGPTVPGTQRPTDGTPVAELNPCPLKACCDVWGYCGTTAEFCTIAPNGGPGTTQPGVASCISNCGMNITNVGQPPKSFSKIAYYESWSEGRPCLHMDPRQIDNSYTHVHYAFADIDETLTISVGVEKNRFQRFQEIKGKKRIITLGGWAQSTEPATYARLRNAVLPENRARFADNVAAFVRFFELDGVDIDWEYPSAQDMPGIPKGSLDEGKNYLELLRLIRDRLPDKSLSIAAPASFWYLKAFPIDQIASVVDYIVYMTYDLNGQWSFGNKWALTGCDNGNCLRSHVNFTETMNDLTMITKAGVPSNKIVVGVPSYGRSFKMENPNCSDPSCFFTGPQSGATPGRCTATAGILARAEIDEIIRNDPTAHTKEIDDVSNVLIYDRDQWVSYVDDTNIQRRIEYFQGLNFAGTANWAVDQMTFLPDMINLPSQETGPAKLPGTRTHGHSASKQRAEARLIPSDLPWMKLTCEAPGMNDKIRDRSGFLGPKEYQEWRWQSLLADDAWKFITDQWAISNASTDHDTFMDEMTNLIHADPISCTMAAANGCTGQIKCLEGRGTGPAATLIINGLIKIHEKLAQMTQLFDEIKPDLDFKLDSFVTTFVSDTNEKIKALDLIVGIVTFGLQMVAAPMFNKWLKGFESFKGEGGNTLGILKDSTAAMMGLAGNTAKAVTGVEPTQQATILQALKTAIPKMFEGWANAIRETNNAIFGEHTGREAMNTAYKLISGGKLERAKLPDDLDAKSDMTAVIYASLLASTWQLQRLRPVVVSTDSNCQAKGAKVGRGFGSEIASKSSACVGDKLYYVLSARAEDNRWQCKDEVFCFKGECPCHREDVFFDALPGIDNLNEWGKKLNRDNLAESAVASVNLWGNAGLSSTTGPNFADSKYMDAAFLTLAADQIVRLPGVFKVPVCSFDDIVKKKWTGPEDRPGYPCPP